MTIDLEGGWAYPLEQLRPDSTLTAKLCRELSNTKKIMSNIPSKKQNGICFAFVFNGLIENKIEERVNNYIRIYGLRFREMALKLFDLRNILNWLTSSTQVHIGYHSYDHLSYEFFGNEALLNDLTRADLFLRDLQKIHTKASFIRLMVFPMNIKPDANLFQIDNWVFRVGTEKNPQTTSIFKNTLNYLRRDLNFMNCIYTQTYYPLGKSRKNSVLRKIQRLRYAVGLGKFIWIHAWELDDENYLRGLFVYL